MVVFYDDSCTVDYWQTILDGKWLCLSATIRTAASNTHRSISAPDSLTVDGIKEQVLESNDKSRFSEARAVLCQAPSNTKRDEGNFRARKMSKEL